MSAPFVNKHENDNDNHNWAQHISYNLRVMLSLMIILILAATGYGFWQQNASKQLNSLSNEYHLSASLHYLEAISHLKDIKQQILSTATQNAKTHSLQKNESFSLSDTLHIAHREIQFGLELQSQFNDSSLSSSSKRLDQNSRELIASAQNAEAFTGNGINLFQDNLGRTLETLDQLVRLHTTMRDNLLQQYQGVLQFEGNIFYSLLTSLLLGGILIAWRSGHAIRGIVSKQKNIESIIKHQATHDELTDLPNRFLILDRLTQRIYDANRNESYIGVLFLDLDNFKKVNDSLGHNIGDDLLTETGQRLVQSLRQGDTVGRLGGDEFVIILSHLENITDIEPVLKKVLQQLHTPFIINKRELLITASIGISVYPDDGTDANSLLQHADSAMYHSKSSGRNTYSYFTDQMHQAINRRIKLEEHMLRALELNEFEVYYQPQVDLFSGQIIGAEALLRWNNPRLDNPGPDEFIPIAEQTGLIVAIGEFVIQSAFKQCAIWQQSHIADFRIAINLSPRQFRSENLIEAITSQIKKNNLAPHNIELEITEGVLLSEQEQITNTLNKLANHNMSLSMDDFGTGYSSLSYLRRFPFSIVKIDRSFISDISSNNMDRELIKAIIAMAHNMNLKVIAEGIEEQHQYHLLQQLGCDYAQGYLLGKPMPSKQFEDFLSEHASNKCGYKIQLGNDTAPRPPSSSHH
jgi:diguanylate cyclase (GGDEF)-like protein